jgi:hypothetical protein
MIGQHDEQRVAWGEPMSQMGSNSDLTPLECDFRYTPESRHRLPNRPCPKGANKRHSLDHRIGAGKQCWRDVESKRFGGLEIDDQFELGWAARPASLRACPPEDLIDVRGQFPDYAIKVRPVRHKSASLCKERIGVDGRQLQPESNLGNAATA